MVDTIKESKYPNMKELRIASKHRVYRILFAFAPERNAILLVGGDKRFYQKLIPLADKLYEQHLEQLRR